MSNLINAIVDKNYDEANTLLEERVDDILKHTFFEMKKAYAAKLGLSEEMVKTLPSVEKLKRGLTEDDGEELAEARVKIIKARIRGGKIQRRKKVSNVAGFTLRGGKLTKMSPSERRKRKLGAKRAKMKRRGKMTRILQKRKRSLMKRKALGI